ncbi:MAG: sulfatase-like hydrolase/transferase [bacterium]|nr:sulfatase-like hydrolase/transferase [bacterium]
MRRYVVKVGVVGGVFVFVAIAWLLRIPLKGLLHPQKPYNVIMISIDTLRADHLGLYRYSRNTSPNLDKFSQESIVFEQAIAQAPFTLPSLASTFTSEYPSAHGLMGTSSRLSSSKLTLAEVLKEHEYNTAAFVGEGELQRVFGIDQGFDRYIDEGGISIKENIPLAEEWLKQNKGSKLFLFLQGFDVHAPYQKPEPYDDMFDKDYYGLLADRAKYWLDYSIKNPKAILDNIKKIDGKPVLVQDDGIEVPLTQQDIDYIIAQYDGGIRYTDDLIQGFFDKLKQMGLYDNSIIIVLAGHGESLGDILKRAHPSTDNLNVVGHGQVYDEVVRVPLIIKYPDLAPKRVSSQVQLIDLFPTILDFLNIPQDRQVKANIQGKSMLPFLEGKQKGDIDPYAFGEGEGGALRFVRTPFWKLIVRGENMFELYRLRDDPGEMTSVFFGHPDIVEQFQEVLAKQYLENLEKKAKTP